MPEFNRKRKATPEGLFPVIPSKDVEMVPLLRALGDRLFEEVWFMPIQSRIQGKNICAVGTVKKKFRILADAIIRTIPSP